MHMMRVHKWDASAATAAITDTYLRILFSHFVVEQTATQKKSEQQKKRIFELKTLRVIIAYVHWPHG